MVLRCVYCHGDLGRRDRLFCAGCLAPHHVACRHTHGRCAAPGCDERHVVRPRLPRAPRTPAERPASPASRSRAGALLTGMAGVAIGCAVVAAGLAVGELLAASPSASPPLAAERTHDRPARQLGLGPGQRLVFLGRAEPIEVLRLDVDNVVTSTLVANPGEDVYVRAPDLPAVTWVSIGPCVVEEPR